MTFDWNFLWWHPLTKYTESTGRRFKSQHKLCFLTLYNKKYQKAFVQRSKSNPSCEYFEPYRRHRLCRVLTFSTEQVVSNEERTEKIQKQALIVTKPSPHVHVRYSPKSCVESWASPCVLKIPPLQLETRKSHCGSKFELLELEFGYFTNFCCWFIVF